MKKIGIFLLCSILFVIISFHLLTTTVDDELGRPIFPSFILINNTYYKASGYSYELLPSGCEYLGDIQSTVPGTELPEKTFQANRDIEGAPVYHIDGKLFVIINNEWWEYLIYSDHE